MTRRAIWLAIGLLIAWPAVSAMPVSAAGSQDVGAREGDPTAWQWQPDSQPAWEGRLSAASVRDILFSRDGRAVYVASDQGIWQGGGRGAR